MSDSILSQRIAADFSAFLSGCFPADKPQTTTRLFKIDTLIRRLDASRAAVADLLQRINASPSGRYRARWENETTVRISLRRGLDRMAEAVGLVGLGILNGLATIVGDKRRFAQKAVPLSYDVICHRLGVARATLSKYLKQLEAAGLIAVQRRRYSAQRRAANTYRLTDAGAGMVKVRIVPDGRVGRPSNLDTARAKAAFEADVKRREARQAQPDLHKHSLSSKRELDMSLSQRERLESAANRAKNGALALVERMLARSKERNSPA